MLLVVFVATCVLANQQQVFLKSELASDKQAQMKPVGTNPLAGLPQDIPDEQMASLEKEKYTFQVQ